jgi:hypothetical protein
MFCVEEGCRLSSWRPRDKYIAVLIKEYLQCCGSRMFIPDPDFYSSRIPDLGARISEPGSRIPDPKTATKERGDKN